MVLYYFWVINMEVTKTGVVQQKKEKISRRRDQTLGEEIGNAITHGCGFIFAVVAMILMLIKCDTALAYVGALIFSFGLLSLYIMSCLYHSFKNGSRVKKIFRFFDHSSIYLLIGGTYAPILLIFVGGTLGYTFFAIQWALIIFSIVQKVVKPIKNCVYTVTISLVIGWSGLVVLPQIMSASMPLFWTILGGGISYSLGIIFFVSRFKYSHFIWHFFVLFGTIIHFIGIYAYVL